jgi:cobalt/nickel transport system permease protein
VVAYFQRANPSLLKLTARGAIPADEELSHVAPQGAWNAAKPLWTALALLLTLTPLGTLAGGAAWGEWGAREFSEAAARGKIAAASRNLAPPAQAPRGLERLYAVWTAPFPQYAPAFVRRPALGYLLSAMFGSGVIILCFLVVSSLFARGGRQPEADSIKTHTRDA